MLFVPNYLTTVTLGACLYGENLLLQDVTFISYQARGKRFVEKFTKILCCPSYS